MIKNIIKKCTPQRIKDKYNKKKSVELYNFISSMPKLSYDRFLRILTDDLNVCPNDSVMIHSSTNQLNLDFSIALILEALRNTVTENGNILFPNYPKVNSYSFLKSGKVFDVRKSPSYTGLLTEFARRTRGSIRSLHPTKSVCTIGKDAQYFSEGHESCIFPYDIGSPYHKLYKTGGKTIGLGVSSNFVSCIHHIDDTMQDKFPVNPYHSELFTAKCIDYSGNTVNVRTYAHNMSKMDFHIPDFIKKYIKKEIAEDINIDGFKFFRVDVKPFLDEVRNLAEMKITIYNKLHYKPKDFVISILNRNNKIRIN